MVNQRQIYISCNKCFNETRHNLEKSIIVRGSEVISTNNNGQEDTIDWSTTSEMLQCCGCDKVTMRETVWFSEGDRVETAYYPPRALRQLPKWSFNLPQLWQQLMDEVYQNLHSDNRITAAIGTRALLDMYVVVSIGDKGNFTQKLETLVTKNFILESERALFDAVLDVGSAATHRGHEPTRDDLITVMDFLEAILHRHTFSQKSVKTLKDNTPRR